VQRLDHRLLEPFRPHSGSSFVDKPLAPMGDDHTPGKGRLREASTGGCPDEEIANVDGGEPLAISFP
jgi:hypothetical protein